MKKSKKLLTLAASLLAMTFVVGCGGGNTPSTPSENPGVSEVVDQGLEDAASTLNEVMKSVNKVTTANFTLPAVIDTLDYTYQVEWALNVHEGGLEGAVSLGEVANNMITINITYSEEFSTAETVYDLVATIKGETNSKVVEFKDFSVPAYKYATIAEWLAKKDESTPMAIRGVVTAVNKLNEASAFTLTDETGSVFSYDKPSEQVNVGDEIVVSSVYSENNGFAQLKAPQVVKKLGTNQLDKVSSQIQTVDINTINDNLDEYKSSSKYLKVTGGYVVLNANGYPTLSIAADNSAYCVNIYYHSSNELKDKVGAQVDIIGVVRGGGSSYSTIQVQSYEIIKEAETPVVPEEEPAIVETTIADLVANAPTESSKAIYQVTGTWATKEGVDPTANTYGNGTLSDANGNSIVIYGLASSREAAKVEWANNMYGYSNPKDFLTLGIEDGDEVTVGMVYDAGYKNYKAFLVEEGGEENPETPVDPETPAHVSTTVNELANNVPSESKTVVYEFEGIWNPTGSSTDVYGNGYIVDPESGKQVKIYGLSADDTCLSYADGVYTYSNSKNYQTLVSGETPSFAAGDKIKVGAIYDTQFKNYSAYFVSKVDSASSFSYKISKTVGENGSATLSAESGVYGDIVTLTVTPNDGYAVESVKFNGVAISANEDGTYSATVAVYANAFEVTFRDANAVVSSYTLTDVKLFGSNNYAYPSVVDAVETLTVVESDATITYKYSQLSTYGNGIQSRIKDSTAGMIYNETAFNKEIASITVVPNSKWTSTTSEMSVSFGTEAITAKPSSFAGTYLSSKGTFTVDCNVEGAKYFRFDHTVKGAIYIDEIIITFVTE